MSSDKRNSFVGTAMVDRFARVLLEFADAPGDLGVTEIARSLGLAKSVVHRILQSLVAQGLAAPSKVRGRYQLGPAAAAIGVAVLTRLDLRQAARPLLWRLRDESNETSTLSALVGTSRVYIDQVESPQEIKMTVDLGRRWPLHAGSTGKVMLAYVDDDLRDHVLCHSMPRLTENTVSDPARLRNELAEIRENGFAVSVGERQQGAASAAAAVFGWHGVVVGAISVCGPSERFVHEVMLKHGQRAVAAATEVTRRLQGGLPPPAGIGEEEGHDEEERRGLRGPRLS